MGKVNYYGVSQNKSSRRKRGVCTIHFLKELVEEYEVKTLEKSRKARIKEYDTYNESYYQAQAQGREITDTLEVGENSIVWKEDLEYQPMHVTYKNKKYKIARIKSIGNRKIMMELEEIK
ncbi:MAG: hypothetical protein ACRCZK_01690 [Oscillospiraceae bacterium]